MGKTEIMQQNVKEAGFSKDDDRYFRLPNVGNTLQGEVCGGA